MSFPLRTERLVIYPASPELGELVAEFYRKNRTFLMPFEPEHGEEFYTAKAQRKKLRAERKEAVWDQALRCYLALQEDPGRIAGTISLSNIVRGGFQSCFLGYKMDEALTSQGYMTEAVGRLVRYAFDELGLHRIEANIMPRNTPSLRVVEKNGFCNEGMSPRYLKINGVWEDHVHMVLLDEVIM